MLMHSPQSVIRSSATICRKESEATYEQLAIQQGAAWPRQQYIRLSPAGWHLGMEQRGHHYRWRGISAHRHTLRLEAYWRDAGRDAPLYSCGFTYRYAGKYTRQRGPLLRE